VQEATLLTAAMQCDIARFTSITRDAILVLSNLFPHC